MGLDRLYGTDLYQWVGTCIPTEEDILVLKCFDECPVRAKPRYMNILGTMVDYGIRIRKPQRDFAYIILGMAMYGDNEQILDLLYDTYLSPNEAQALAKWKPGKQFSVQQVNKDLFLDYVNLTERGSALYNILNLGDAWFGRYYSDDGIVQSFEPDCISADSVFDTKVTRNATHTRDYWTQVLLYSLLSHRQENISRRRIGLVYPVQGEIRQYIYPTQYYASLCKVFDRRYMDAFG